VIIRYNGADSIGLRRPDVHRLTQQTVCHGVDICAKTGMPGQTGKKNMLSLSEGPVCKNGTTIFVHNPCNSCNLLPY
jgi:hypothetical protein